MSTIPERTKVFISYSHKDAKHLDRLHVHLAHYERLGLIESWDDTKIVPGTVWREEIKRAMASAKVAILLVSADFLASKFIAEDELPPLLSAAQAGGAVILSIILSPGAFESSSLSQFQALNPPSKPLSKRNRHEKEEVWLKAAQAISNAGISLRPLASGDKDLPQVANEGLFEHVEYLDEERSIKTGQYLWDHYEVREIVGKTDHSQVIKAWDVPLMRFVAIKLLLLDQKLDKRVVLQHRDNLLREARILATLEHKNIGKIYSLRLEPLAFVMQWVEGRSLYERFLEDSPIPVATAVKIGVALADALNYVHGKGIVHGDVKPSNIILNEHEEAILIDFDIAHSDDLNRSTQQKYDSPTYAGTMEYSAPEQFENPDVPGPSADVFALGLVLYQALTWPHQHPYQFGNNPKYYKGRLPSLEQHDIPDPLYEILCAILSQEPKKRPEASELKVQLQTYLTILEKDYGKETDDIKDDQPNKEIVVGHYRILKQISSNDLFVTFEAQHTFFPIRHVRLKRYQLPRSSLTPANSQRFERSARAMSALGSHPHILNTLDFFRGPEDPSVFYEVTELADGKRLDEIMNAGQPLSLEDQLNYLEQICKALAHAHNHVTAGRKTPIYHRNICPETIFVTNDGLVKLADFDFVLNVNKKFGSARITAAAPAHSVSSPPSPCCRSAAVLAR